MWFMQILEKDSYMKGTVFRYSQNIATGSDNIDEVQASHVTKAADTAITAARMRMPPCFSLSSLFIYIICLNM